MLREKFHDDIPETVDELCTLPGVGPKMAHLCMKSAWGKVTGIGNFIKIRDNKKNFFST